MSRISSGLRRSHPNVLIGGAKTFRVSIAAIVTVMVTAIVGVITAIVAYGATGSVELSRDCAAPDTVQVTATFSLVADPGWVYELHLNVGTEPIVIEVASGNVGDTNEGKIFIDNSVTGTALPRGSVNVPWTLVHSIDNVVEDSGSASLNGCSTTPPTTTATAPPSTITTTTTTTKAPPPTTKTTTPSTTTTTTASSSPTSSTPHATSTATQSPSSSTTRTTVRPNTAATTTPPTSYVTPGTGAPDTGGAGEDDTSNGGLFAASGLLTALGGLGAFLIKRRRA